MRRRPFEQGERPLRIARTSTTVRQHFRERRLGFDNARFGCTPDPCAAFDRVGAKPAAFIEQPSIPVLCFRHRLSRLAKPLCGACVIALGAHALRKTDSEIESGHGIAAGRGCLDPFSQPEFIGRDAHPDKEKVC